MTVQLQPVGPPEPVSLPAEIMEQLVQGDLSGLSAGQRVTYYRTLCDHLGIDPATQPFSYLTLNGKLVLYANKTCAEQLRKRHAISIHILDRGELHDVYTVVASAQLPSGRVDESMGAVSLGNLKGDALANAVMKTETKAKRRVTLSICGLGMLDETEIETIPGARIVPTSEAETDLLPPEVKPPEAKEPAPEKPRKPRAKKESEVPEEVQALYRRVWPKINEFVDAVKDRDPDAAAQFTDGKLRRNMWREHFKVEHLSDFAQHPDKEARLMMWLERRTKEERGRAERK